jgi:hypothetical protein
MVHTILVKKHAGLNEQAYDVIYEEGINIDIGLGDASSAQFTVYDPTHVFDLQQGSRWQIYIDGTLVFIGWAESIEAHLITRQASLMVHVISCVGTKYITDKQIIAPQLFVDTTPGEVVNDLVTLMDDDGVTSTYGTDIIEPGIFPSNTAGVAVCGQVYPWDYYIKVYDPSYQTITKVLDVMAERSLSYWLIDETKHLYFKALDEGTGVAPWTLTRDKILGMETCKLMTANPKYRNTMIMKRVGRDLGRTFKTWEGDGENITYDLGNPIRDEPEIYVDGLRDRNIGYDGETGHNWYWSMGNAVISRDETIKPLQKGDKLRIVFYPYVVSGGGPGSYTAWSKADAVSARAAIDDCSGYVYWLDEGYDCDRSTSDAIARALCDYYSETGKKITFDTLDGAGVKVGQILTVNIPEFNLNNVDMIISNVSIAGNPHYLVYTVTACTGCLVGDWSQVYNYKYQS